MIALRDYLNRSRRDATGFGWKEENESGFCVWRVEQNNVLVVPDVYGDGAYWDAWLTQKAEEMDCKTIRILTKRSPKALERKYGYSITEYVMEKAVNNDS